MRFHLKPGQILNVNTQLCRQNLQNLLHPDVLFMDKENFILEQVYVCLEMTRCLEQHFDVHFYLKMNN